MWLGLRKLFEHEADAKKAESARVEETGKKDNDEPSKIQEPPDDVRDDLVLLLERAKVGSDWRIRLSSSNGVLLLRGRGETESEVDGGRLEVSKENRSASEDEEEERKEGWERTFCRLSSSSTTMHGTCQVKHRSINEEVWTPE